MVLRQGVRDGKPWLLAACLVELELEANELAPARSKASDGSIGDAAHAARKSAHNPDVNGFVCALDLTHDPSGGFDAIAVADTIAARCVAGLERRVAGIGSYNYATGSERWFDPARGTWRDTDLHGASHRTHMHLECRHADLAYRSTDGWGLTGEEDMPLSDADLAKIEAITNRVVKAQLDKQFAARVKDGTVKDDALTQALANFLRGQGVPPLA